MFSNPTISWEAAMQNLGSHGLKLYQSVHESQNDHVISQSSHASLVVTWLL